MKSHVFLYLLLALFALFFSSCGDDPKMVEKREKQKAEISRLKGELALIEEKMKNQPPDVSDNLAEAKKIFEKQTAEVSGLEGEVADLESRKRSLQADFDAYKAKYEAK
jgi:molecular chaperone GrpE (heat shock protein)